MGSSSDSSGDSYSYSSNTTPQNSQTTTIEEEQTPLSEFPIFYVDAADDSWYHDVVAYATALGIMGGIGRNKLAPTGSATRAQLATMLMRFHALYTAEV